MKKTISILLSFAMLLSMACMLGGCASDAEKIIGTWEADIDYAAAFNKGLTSAEGMEEMGDYFSVDDFVLTTTFTFREDGTYSVEVDEDSAKAAIEGIKDDLRDGIEKFYEDLIKESGLNISVSDMLAASGMTLDSLVDSLFTEDKMDELIGEMADEYTGNYEVGDGKIYMTEKEDEEINEEYYDTYKLNGDTLTLLECHCKQEEGSEDISEAIYPVTLKRVGK